MIRKKIGVYVDHGAGELSAVSMLGALASYGEVHEIDINAIWKGNILAKLDALVIPGGNDTQYSLKLYGKVIERVREFIKDGGRYFGVGAGARFACSKTVFQETLPDRISGPRELALFRGSAVGSIYEFAGPYDRTTNTAAVVNLRMQDNSRANCFYWGGPYFEAAPDTSNYHVLAYYDLPSDINQAIIELPFGDGRVILSGCHPEISGEMLARFLGEKKNEVYCRMMIRKLVDGDAARKALLEKLLDRLFG